MYPLEITHPLPDSIGRYLCSGSVTYTDSNIACPYCERLLLISHGRHAIKRLDKAGESYGDILPPRIVVLACKPCLQLFCVDPIQEG